MQKTLYAGEAHKKHLEILRQILFSGTAAPSPSPGPGPGPDPGPGPEPTPTPTPTVEENDVTFYDWDGTILYSYTAAEALALEALPEIPDRSSASLYGGQWNWTLEEIKTCVRAIGMCSIGANYETMPDATEYDIPPTFFDIQMDDAVKRLDLYCGNPGTYEIDWGDGTTTTETTGTASTKTFSHIYSDKNPHTVKIQQGQGTTWGISIPPASDRAIKSARIGFRTFAGEIVIGGQNLGSISLPPGLVLSNQFLFGGVYKTRAPKLKHITLPRVTGTAYTDQPVINAGWAVPGGMTVSCPYSMFSEEGGSFGGYRALIRNFMLPKASTYDWPHIAAGGRTICNANRGLPGSGADFPPARLHVYLTENADIGEGTGLASLHCGPNVSSVSFVPFSHTEGADLYIPSTVTSIGGAYLGNYCGVWNARSIHLQSTTPPRVERNSDQISSRIYVPAEAVNTYKNATNWSVYSDYIFPEAEEVIW